MNNMTIFYRKRDLYIDAICDGEQDLGFYGELDPQDAALIYGYMYVPSDKFILKNKKGFYLSQSETGELVVNMTEDFKTKIESFLK